MSNIHTYLAALNLLSLHIGLKWPWLQFCFKPAVADYKPVDSATDGSTHSAQRHRIGVPSIPCKRCRQASRRHRCRHSPPHFFPFLLQDPTTHAEAERTLQQFRASPAPYAACQYILDNSADSAAKFQSILALRDAALREWTSPSLPPQMRAELLRFLLHAAIVKFGADPEPLVRRQAAAAAAALLKRAWGEATAEERTAFINEIESLAAGAGSAEARRSGMDVLTAVVLEFSPATSSPMGLPWDYHEACKQQLQDFLPGFLKHGLDMARQSAPAALAGADAGACVACLNLLSALLSWQYTHPTSAPSSWAGDAQRPGDVTLQCRPPPMWRDVLLADDAFSWLGPLAAGVRASPDTPLACATRQLLVQLASMAGDVFAREGDRAGLGLVGPPGPATRGRHLALVFSILLPEVTPAEAAAARAAAHEEAVADACRALLAAAAAHRLGGFMEAASALDGGAPALFGALSDLTAALLAQGDAPGAEEAGDVLLEAWAELCVDPCRGAIAGSEHMVGPAASVFAAAMRRELARAAAAAWEDEAEYEGGEEAHSEAWLSGVAAIGRAACSVVLPALGHQLQECQGALTACAARNEDPSAALEQLCWVVKICGAVLADAGDGETPLVPVAVADACAAAAAAGQEDPAAALARRLLALGAVCQQHAGEAVISPRLLEEVCAALGRWAETYLAPETPAGDVGPPGEVADGLIRLAMAALTRYPGDKALHRAVCVQLMAPLLRRRASAAAVAHSAAWGELASAAAGRVDSLQALEAGVQRRLTECLLRASTGLSEPQQYAASLMTPLTSGVLALAELPNTALQQADKASLALNLVQSLRGAARGGPAELVYLHLEAAQPALLRLLDGYQSQPGVYAQILKLGADAVEHNAAGLDAGRARILFAWAVQLTAAYASHRPTATAEASLALEDERRALCALLRLLTQLTNAEAPDEGDVAAAVFEGLDRIMPGIKHDHLKFPKLRRAFFGLVAHMVEAHASRVAGLPPPTFSALMSALCFGIGVREDSETEAAVFEAAGALARHHVLSLRHGQPGLGALNADGAALGGLLHATLQRVLVDDPGFEAVDYAAEAALPLWLAEPAAAQAAMGAAVSGCDEAASAAVGTAFAELSKAAQTASALDRASRREFGRSFRRFVLEVRGAMRRR